MKELMNDVAVLEREGPLSFEKNGKSKGLTEKNNDGRKGKKTWRIRNRTMEIALNKADLYSITLGTATTPVPVIEAKVKSKTNIDREKIAEKLRAEIQALRAKTDSNLHEVCWGKNGLVVLRIQFEGGSYGWILIECVDKQARICDVTTPVNSLKKYNHWFPLNPPTFLGTEETRPPRSVRIGLVSLWYWEIAEAVSSVQNKS